MAPISSDPKRSPNQIREAADRGQLRAAAKAGYEGQAAVQVPEAVKLREDRRLERERQAFRRHYLGTPAPVGNRGQAAVVLEDGSGRRLPAAP